MTVDPEEGRRQIEAMKPEPLKVGDKVRLTAGTQVMTVVGVADYGNIAHCQWAEVVAEKWGDDAATVITKTMGDTFPVSSLVRVEAP